MKLSIVIICWNDLKVIGDCLKSIYDGTKSTDFEVIVSDNGSADGSLDFVRRHYPQARIVENRANLGYARGNNTGIAVCQGDYILILNPDTIIHPGALDTWMQYAGRHPEAGAFGCRVLNPDGSYQEPARPFPTNYRYWLAALYMWPLAKFTDDFLADRYVGWSGQSEREIDWQSGCCILFRADVLRNLNGFDERFFYHFEEVDLCYRTWHAGHKILYTPDVVITHLGGQSVGRFPIRFALEKFRNRYRYFHKHYGLSGAIRCRRASLAHLWVRRIGYGLLSLVKNTEAVRNRVSMYKVAIEWNQGLDPGRFIETGAEPDLGYAPLAPPPKAPSTMMA